MFKYQKNINLSGSVEMITQILLEVKLPEKSSVCLINQI